MDINNPIKQAVYEALGLTSPSPQPAPSPPGLVLVRGDRSGVFLGRIVASEDHGRVVTLDECRHVWSWTGALNVVDLAARGPSGGRITAPVRGARVLDVIEVVPVTAAAEERFGAVQAWAP